jgi:outer membrane protein, multidrug efflux system
MQSTLICRLASVGLAALWTSTSLAAPPAIAVPDQWQSPAPVVDSRSKVAAPWWTTFDDPTIAELVTAARKASPTVAAVRAQLAESRAALAGTEAAFLPSVDVGANLTRAGERRSSGNPLGAASAPATTLKGSVEARWEWDLFGRNRAATLAASATAQAIELSVAEAHLAVAGEVANAYVNLRYCEQQLTITGADRDSRLATASLSQKSQDAGLLAPATNRLAQAGAALASGRYKALVVECRAAQLALAALIGEDERELAMRLAARTAQLPQAPALAALPVPAALLEKRPDVARGRAELAARAAQIDVARRAQYPTINLLGLITPARIRLSGADATGTGWSIGPALTLPLFDGGRIRANLTAAEFAYAEQVLIYSASVREVVREVETALTLLDGFVLREPDIATAVAGFEALLKAEEAKQRAGLGSLFELEEARRQTLDAQSTLLTIARDRLLAYIQLQRALAGVADAGVGS